MIVRVVLTGIVLSGLAACTSKTERDYIRGCVSNGAPKELCECSYEKLEGLYSKEVFSNLEKGIVPADFMDKMVQSTQMCITKG